MKRKHYIGWLLLIAAALSACVGDADLVNFESESAQEVEEEPILKESDGTQYSEPVEGSDGRMQVKPIATIKASETFPAQVSFYVWEDLSAAYLLSQGSGTAGLDPVGLNGLSAAEIFWALSTSGAEVPKQLIEHHAAMVADGEFVSWVEVTEAKPQGWYRAGETVSYAIPQCNDISFGLSHCFTGFNSYVGSFCRYNDPYWWINTRHTRRFKAGFCADSGSGLFFDWLSYKTCGLPFPQNVPVDIWNDDYANATYLSFEWIAPNTAASRAWNHQGFRKSGNIERDFASMWGPAISCNFPD